MKDVLYVGMQIILFAISVYALRLFTHGQGKSWGRND